MSTDMPTYVWILLHLYQSVYEIEAVYGREEDANAAMDSRRKPEPTTRLKSGLFMEAAVISHLNGGNCSREEAEQYRREFANVEGWDGRVTVRPATCQPGQLHQRFPFVVGRTLLCPRCGGRMREVSGYDDYCPECRMRAELEVEREAVATGYLQPQRWEDWDVPNND